jgi:hypothetical protein
VTTFFIAGVDGDCALVDRAYGDMSGTLLEFDR